MLAYLGREVTRRAGATSCVRVAAIVFGLALGAQIGEAREAAPRGTGSGTAGGERSRLAAGKFLVASGNLRDTNFSRTVVLLLDYGRNGAKGLIINRRTPLRLSSVFPKYESIDADRQRVFEGGPVGRDALLMLVRSAAIPGESMRIFADVHLSTSEALLESMLRDGKATTDFRVYSGFAGWAPGQLDAEVERDDWYIVAPDPESVFDADPDRTWFRLLPRDPTLSTGLRGLPPVEPAAVMAVSR